MNVGYYESIGSKLGCKYRGIYGDIRSVLASGVKLLWGLRSGQIPAIIDHLSVLRNKLESAKSKLKDYLFICVFGLSW